MNPSILAHNWSFVVVLRPRHCFATATSSSIKCCRFVSWCNASKRPRNASSHSWSQSPEVQ
eukprot:4642592-Amphidinium_carterae.1